tara:strand:- start:13707 stop:14312 length:606 start_codon:yes stop_codon:yes gene_type:complete
MALHNTLTGAELHEPKGAASAAVNKIYVSDGAGSGTWKALYTQGFEDYADTGTAQALTSGAFVDLTNDGAVTSKTYKLPDGRGDIWNISTNRFDWAEADLQLGDTVDIRFDLTITTVNANDDIILAMDLAIGGSPYTLDILTAPIKDAGTYQQTIMTSIYMGDANTLGNLAKVSMFSDAAGNSVVVNGWYVRTVPRQPILV